MPQTSETPRSLQRPGMERQLLIPARWRMQSYRLPPAAPDACCKHRPCDFYFFLKRLLQQKKDTEDAPKAQESRVFEM